MRKCLFVVAFLSLSCLMAVSGEFSRVFLPDLLPANTIACLVPPDSGAREREYSGTLFQRLGQLPEMEAFLRGFDESRRAFAADIAQTASIPPQFAADLINAHIGLALINMGVGRDGKPAPEFIVALSLPNQPDRAMVFAAVMAILNRPEVVRTVLESQGLDPNLPLKTLAQEETLSGYPPVLRIGPDIRVAQLGNLILLYRGHGSDGIRKIFDVAANPATSLSANPSFQTVYRGAETKPGMSFTFVNVPRLMSILDAANLGKATYLADAAGLSSVQSLGLAGGYQGDGIRHNLFLHTPGNHRTGLMSTLSPMPADSPVGMESFSQAMPSTAEAFMAMRVDVSAFMTELPYFLAVLGGSSHPGGMSGLLANEKILGVPVAEAIRSLGNDIVIRPHDDTHVLLFNNVDIPAFENIVARMEQNAGQRFSSLNVGGYVVRYFNRRASLATPLAPAFCLIPRQQGGARGILYMASHPQAVVSLIRESASAREPLSRAPDFMRAAAGMGSGYSLFYYNDSRESYRRFYNFILPLASVWASSAKYPVDTGLLPTAASVTPGLFGFALGVKIQPEGMAIHAYSPVGFNGMFIILADKLVISNPLVISYVYTLADSWLSAIPTW